MSRNEPKSPKRTALGGGCAALFFGVFFLAGSAGVFFMFVKPAWQSYQARNWLEAPCVILSSEVGVSSGSDGTTYGIKIVYNYYVNDVEYTSDQYEFLSVGTSGRSRKEAVVRRYPPGTETVCYVDPKDPSQAVINRELPGTVWFGLIPLVFVVVGGGGIYFSLRKSRDPATRPKSSGARLKWLASRRPAVPVPDAQAGAGPVTLKPKAGPVAKFIGSIFFCLFWNGIVSVFVTLAVKAWLSGRGSIIEKWILPTVFPGNSSPSSGPWKSLPFPCTSRPGSRSPFPQPAGRSCFSHESP